jgi:nucleotide-binding universal stress UspA family protein
VVGVDGSEASEPALGYAFAHAASTGCGLTAVLTWCWEPLGVNLGEPWTGDWTQIANQEATLVAESLAGWSQKYPDVPVLRHVVRGDPVDELLEQSHGASLLVVGARPAAPLPCPLVRPPASEGLRHRPGPDARTP